MRPLLKIARLALAVAIGGGFLTASLQSDRIGAYYFDAVTFTIGLAPGWLTKRIK